MRCTHAAQVFTPKPHFTYLLHNVTDSFILVHTWCSRRYQHRDTWPGLFDRTLRPFIPFLSFVYPPCTRSSSIGRQNYILAAPDWESRSVWFRKLEMAALLHGLWIEGVHCSLTCWNIHWECFWYVLLTHIHSGKVTMNDTYHWAEGGSIEGPSRPYYYGLSLQVYFPNGFHVIIWMTRFGPFSDMMFLRESSLYYRQNNIVIR